jgi:ankyrin repeat protein
MASYSLEASVSSKFGDTAFGSTAKMAGVDLRAGGTTGGVPFGSGQAEEDEEKNPRPSRPDMEAAIAACRRGDVEFLRHWVSIGGTLETKLDNSYVSLTLLQLAACEGDEVAAHTVLRAGADVNDIEPHEGYSSLMIAARYDHVGVMRLLLGSGANINLVDSLGHNALHYAATSGQLSAAKLLLDDGIDTEALNDFNRSAVELSVTHGHPDIANAIRQKRAENGSRDDGRISAWLQAIDLPQYIDVLLGCGWDDIDFIAVSWFYKCLYFVCSSIGARHIFVLTLTPSPPPGCSN